MVRCSLDCRTWVIAAADGSNYDLEQLLPLTFIAAFLHFAKYFGRCYVIRGWNWARLYLRNADADRPGFA